MRPIGFSESLYDQEWRRVVRVYIVLEKGQVGIELLIAQPYFSQERNMQVRRISLQGADRRAVHLGLQDT